MRKPRSQGPAWVGIETVFDPAFATSLALREKQIQQNYRPVIGVHKWFARRPGTLFRCLLLSEYAKDESLQDSFWKSHNLKGTIGDPFMGGGTPIYEANRLGFHVVGSDINPMAHWIVSQSLTPLDLAKFSEEAASIADHVEELVGDLYRTMCLCCGQLATVKYFIHVKIAPCPACHAQNDLFPGFRLAEAERHPFHVLACSKCGALNEYKTPPTRKQPSKCSQCGHGVHIEGNVTRKLLTCRQCAHEFSIGSFKSHPQHRLWAIEYRCHTCYPTLEGRQFKVPDKHDLDRERRASTMLAQLESSLPIPDDTIPPGDETDRLHRWGYHRYRDMFSDRQLLGLGILLKQICTTRSVQLRHALLTVFSDTLRYQNMLCRYDTYALKCQDIFSVHGFPVGLIQCENNLLGIPKIGSGSFRHFIEKYLRAKEYCAAPFETRLLGRKKSLVKIDGETIAAQLITTQPTATQKKQAFLLSTSANKVPLKKNSLDGVFTDPPYFDNVQYAELMDFCFAWLRRALRDEFPSFASSNTRSADELTGNETLGKGLEHFTTGIAEVFVHFARALKPGKPFVFTYHHNDPTAYLPLVVAILDAQLTCTATLPAAAEMSASLHIAGTNSSILDSVFVCRKLSDSPPSTRQKCFDFDAAHDCKSSLMKDARSMLQAGLRVTAGDLRCLLAGHIARTAINQLLPQWNRKASLSQKIDRARSCIAAITQTVNVSDTVESALKSPPLITGTNTLAMNGRHDAPV